MPEYQAAVTESALSYAKAQEKQLALVDKRISTFVKQYAEAIHSAAKLAVKSGSKLELNDAAFDRVIEELSGLMVFSHVLAASANQQSKVNFSSVDKAAKKAAKGLKLNLGKLSGQMIELAKRPVRESLHTVRRRINEFLQETHGKSEKKRIAELEKRLEEMGVTPRSSGYIATIVKTHTQLAYGMGQKETLDEDDSVWGYMGLTMEDSKVRINHEPFHGFVRKADDPIWASIWPPNGWNCRCWVVPLYEPQRQSPITAKIQAIRKF